MNDDGALSLLLIFRAKMEFHSICEGDSAAKAAADEWLKQAEAARRDALGARREREKLSCGTRIDGAVILEDSSKPWTAILQILRSCLSFLLAL